MIMGWCEWCQNATEHAEDDVDPECLLCRQAAKEAGNAAV